MWLSSQRKTHPNYYCYVHPPFCESMVTVLQKMLTVRTRSCSSAHITSTRQMDKTKTVGAAT